MRGGSLGGRSGGSSKDKEKCDPAFAEKMRRVYRANGVRRGQILYRGMWENSLTGHAAIILRPDIPRRNICEHLLSIDAYKSGVYDSTVRSWNYRHYVLGVRKIWYTWERSWWFFKKRVRHEERILNMDKVAQEAEKKRGDPYSCHIFRSKHYDREFICSSLVWYSVKHGCGVDLASWRPHTIWPTDLWLDSKTFVVAKVER